MILWRARAASSFLTSGNGFVIMFSICSSFPARESRPDVIVCIFNSVLAVIGVALTDLIPSHRLIPELKSSQCDSGRLKTGGRVHNSVRVTVL